MATTTSITSTTRAPGWLLNTSVIVAAALILFCAAIPGMNLLIDPVSDTLLVGRPLSLGLYLIELLFSLLAGDAGTFTVLLVTGWLLWGLVLVGWFARFLRHRSLFSPRSWTQRGRWLLVPMLSLGVLVLLASDMPVRVGLELHHPALSAVLERARAAGGDLPHGGWVGMYPVGAVRAAPHDRGGFVRIRPDAAIEKLYIIVGFGYSSEGVSSDCTYTVHLGHGWYKLANPE